MSTQLSAMKERGVKITYVDIDEDYVLFENGVRLPITAYLDDDWEEVDDKLEASYYDFGDEEHGYGTSPLVFVKEELH